MKKITFKKNICPNNTNLYDYLSVVVPKLNNRNITRYAKLEKIKVNNHVENLDYILKECDFITLDIPDDFFTPIMDDDFMKADDKIDILYQDENIILINKSKNILTQPDSKEKINTISNKLKKYLYLKKEYNPKSDIYFAPTLCNRLDFNTEGILIGAKNIQSLRILNKKIADNEIQKFYLCWVQNKPPKNQDTLIGYLQKDFKNNIVKIYDKKIKNSLKVITKYKFLSCKDNVSLLEIELITGKSHQIRAHMQHIGCPVLGDKKYNDKNSKTSQQLKAYKICFNFKTDAGKLNYLKDRTFELK